MAFLSLKTKERCANGRSHHFYHLRLLIGVDFSQRLAPTGMRFPGDKKRAFIVNRQLLEITMKKTTLNSHYYVAKKKKTWRLFNRSLENLTSVSYFYLNRERG